MASIFRKKSLEKLSSPERLDMLMSVTDARGWLALAAIAVLLGLAVTWSLVGQINVTVKGNGILLRAGGIRDIVALGQGQLSEVTVRVGDTIRRGQIVARISQPVMQDRIHNARSDLEEARSTLRQLTEVIDTDRANRKEVETKQRTNIANAISTLEQRGKWLGEEIANLSKLEADGLIKPAQVRQVKDQLSTTLQQIADTRLRLDDITSQQLAKQATEAKQLLEARHRAEGLERQVALLEEQYIVESRVVSPYDGRVIELKTGGGSLVYQGSPVLAVEPLDRNLEGLLYVEAKEGKKIRPGMEVSVNPSTVAKEEYGSIVGVVTSVAIFPATKEGMKRILGNTSLVESLSKEGPPIAVTVALIPDQNTSGYKWTSSAGPPQPVQTGTLCEATVALAAQRPITLIIPALRDHTGAGEKGN